MFRRALWFFSDDPWDIAERIERKLDRVLVLLRSVIKSELTERVFDMATQAALDKLTADVAANTDAANAAALALNGFVQTTADLTAALNAALAAAGVDDATVLAAAQAIEANNATLTAAVPAVAAAVVEGTQ